MARADAVIQYGLAEVGEPYVYGAEGPDAFDCSGLMQWIFGKVGITLPRTARQQQGAVTPVAEPRAGDLVFWGNPATHVALYVGDGQVLSAPHAGERVRVQSIWGSPTYGRVPGLGSPTVAAAAGAVMPVANFLDDQLDKLGDVGKLFLFVAGGATLAILGALRLAKGAR